MDIMDTGGSTDILRLLRRLAPSSVDHSLIPPSVDHRHAHYTPSGRGVVRVSPRGRGRGLVVPCCHQCSGKRGSRHLPARRTPVAVFTSFGPPPPIHLLTSPLFELPAHTTHYTSSKDNNQTALTYKTNERTSVQYYRVVVVVTKWVNPKLEVTNECVEKYRRTASACYS
ncbi:hypothetical protein B0H10DRAFT_642610 [Mycena sp. CBHHK59/15]|nr:hypothetical protein B0H10DRAFT_642610 [Mycena sp. CBHHK59/15]